MKKKKELDPIMEEVRRIREEYAKKFNYDLDAIAEDIMKTQRTSGRKYVSFEKKPAKNETKSKTTKKSA